MPGTEPRPQRWEVRVLPPCPPNSLQGNIPVGTDQKAKLKRFKSFYQELTSKGVSHCRLAKNSDPLELVVTVSKSFIEKL